MRLRLLLIVAAIGCLLLHPVLRSALYPLAYEDVILACGREYDVPAALICGVIRRESRFRENATSRAGAYGLMQLTEPTFRELCAELGLASTEEIMSPYHNVRCGIYYLRCLYDRYGSWETALAAYNAGLGNVDRWLEDPRYTADGKTLHTIPYRETAAYVQDVLKTKEIYYILYHFGS